MQLVTVSLYGILLHSMYQTVNVRCHKTKIFVFICTALSPGFSMVCFHIANLQRFSGYKTFALLACI